MKNFKSNWNKCLELIRSNIGEERFSTWFSKVDALEFCDGCLVLKVPTHFYMDKLENDFYNVMRSALRHVFGCNVKLEYEYNVIGNDNRSKIKVESPQQSHLLKNKVEMTASCEPVEKRTVNFDPQLSTMLNFENYCVGKSNRLPFTIAEHIANHPEKPDFNPFFLYGSVGVGKTHLIQAIGIRIKERNPRARVLFLSMRQFQNLYANATRKKEIPDFINWFQQMDALLFDDLQELSGKVGTAEALFPIFQYLHQNNKKLVFTCDRPPMELDGIADRLIDRFKWGITEPLESPDYNLRRDILNFKARKSGLDLSEDIIDLIARSATTSVRELEGIVMGLYTRSIACNSPITLDLAQEVISHFVKKPAKKIINFDMIVENTAEFYKLNPDAIFSKSRLRDIADARQMIMYLCKKHTNLSSPAIGAKLNRKHATVLHGISAVADRLRYSQEMSDAVCTIESALLK
ncbi:MAG: chromosomal replication initiator protein DnaA [Candidatus Amulumruptor caecigallinarius]|nr:chromosomal replication initiator protein DnaA [Candidatus Amulumruptor caecigallinarius]